jgi:hypothetical protein
MMPAHPYGSPGLHLSRVLPAADDADDSRWAEGETRRVAAAPTTRPADTSTFHHHHDHRTPLRATHSVSSSPSPALLSLHPDARPPVWLSLLCRPIRHSRRCPRWPAPPPARPTAQPASSSRSSASCAIATFSQPTRLSRCFSASRPAVTSSATSIAVRASSSTTVAGAAQLS